MGNRTLGDEVEDHWLGTQGIDTGGISNVRGLEERKNAQAGANTGFVVSNDRSSSGSSSSFEEVTAGLIGLALWGGISYYGITELKLDWYWPVGIGLAVASAMIGLLKGPLYFLLTWIKWLFYLSMVIGVIYVVARYQWFSV